MSDDIVSYYNLKDRDRVDAVTPPSTEWTPAQLAGSYWWDASDTATITEANDLVSDWQDKNQSASLSQSVTNNQPTTNTRTINSLNVIDFDGTSDCLNGPVLGLASFTKHVVFAVDNTTSANNLFSYAGGLSGGSGDAIYMANSNKVIHYHDGAHRITSSAISANTGYIVGVTAQDTGGSNVASELFINGTSEGTSTYGGISTGTTPSEVGAFISDNFLNGVIAEIVILPTAASLDDRQKLEGYSAHKWGLTEYLPGGHPYKTSAPTI